MNEEKKGMTGKVNTSPKRAVSLRLINVVLISLAVVVSVFLFAVISRTVSNYESIRFSTEKYNIAQSAAIQLREGTDYLTEQARHFAVTSEIVYLENYFTEVKETQRRNDAVEKIRNVLDGRSLAKRYSFWCAYWGSSCPLDDAQMWQFGGSVNQIRPNTVAGVVCDQDYAFVDYPAKIAAKGLNGMKKPSAPKPSPAEDLKVLYPGDRVRMKPDAVVYGSTNRFAPWVYEAVLYVREVAGDRVVVSTQKSGAVTGAVGREYLVKV